MDERIMLNDFSKIDAYDYLRTWYRTETPLPLADNQSVEDALKESDWEPFLNTSDDAIEIYAHGNGQFLVMFNTFTEWRMILAVNLPSLIELLGKLSPILRMLDSSAFRHATDDLRELLTDHGGPLESQAGLRQARQDAARNRFKERTKSVR